MTFLFLSFTEHPKALYKSWAEVGSLFGPEGTFWVLKKQHLQNFRECSYYCFPIPTIFLWKAMSWLWQTHNNDVRAYKMMLLLSYNKERPPSIKKNIQGSHTTLILSCIHSHLQMIDETSIFLIHKPALHSYITTNTSPALCLCCSASLSITHTVYTWATITTPFRKAL